MTTRHASAYDRRLPAPVFLAQAGGILILSGSVHAARLAVLIAVAVDLAVAVAGRLPDRTPYRGIRCPPHVATVGRLAVLSLSVAALGATAGAVTGELRAAMVAAGIGNVAAAALMVVIPGRWAPEAGHIWGAGIGEGDRVEPSVTIWSQLPLVRVDNLRMVLRYGVPRAAVAALAVIPAVVRGSLTLASGAIAAGALVIMRRGGPPEPPGDSDHRVETTPERDLEPTWPSTSPRFR